MTNYELWKHALLWGKTIFETCALNIALVKNFTYKRLELHTL
jgi:hypothetical protein